MTVVVNTELRPDQTPWQYGLVRIGVRGDGFNDAGGQIIDVARDLTDDTGLASFDLAAGQYYVWTGPDRRQVNFGPVPATGGPYTVQSLANTGTPPGPLAATAEALAALAAQLSALNWRGVAFLEDYGTPGGVDDSALFATAISTAAAAGKMLRLQPGVTYRAHGLTVPAGFILDNRGAPIKAPAGVTAKNILTGAGPWTWWAGELDGNKGSNTSPADITKGNGIYQYAAGGWPGQVTILGDVGVIHDCWENGVHAATDITSLTDGASAPSGAIVGEGLEVLNCAAIGVRLTGIRGVKLRSLNTHANGSHGARSFLCRDLTVADANCHDNPSGHGMSSLYCYDQEVSGKFNSNGTDGLVFGGDSTSPTNQPGRYIRVPSAECNGNANIGLVLDATITSLHAPVPVWAQLGIVHADGNTNEGVTVNSSQWAFFDQVFTDNNGGHGLEFATRNAGFGFHHAHGNGQKPLALEGNSTDPNWGAHWIGQRDYAGNTPDDTITLGTVLAASTWLTPTTSVGPPSPPGGGVITPADHGLIAWSRDPASAGASTIPTAGLLQLVEVKVPQACTITKLAVYIASAGVTLTNGFLALYDSSLNLLGVTATRATAWQSVGADIVALVTPAAVAAGTYYVGFWWTGTTGPGFARQQAGSANLVNFNVPAGGLIRYGTSTSGLTTTAPNPAAALTRGSADFFAAVL